MGKERAMVDAYADGERRFTLWLARVIAIASVSDVRTDTLDLLGANGRTQRCLSKTRRVVGLGSGLAPIRK